MKNYDHDINNGIHTVRVTLQTLDYVGHIIYKLTGNCKGRDILDFDFWCEDTFENNDCYMKYDDQYRMFSCILTNSTGAVLKCEGDAKDMNDMIVAVEIIDFVADVEED